METTAIDEISSELTIKTQKRRHWPYFVIFIVNFEHILHIFLVFSLLNLINSMSTSYSCFLTLRTD